MGLKEKIQGKRVYLDTNIFVYIFESYETYKASLETIIDSIASTDIKAFTSELTLGEILVFPLKNNDQETVEKYIDIFNDSFFVSLMPTTQSTHIEAAHIRAFSGEKYPDAIHIATALLNNCEILITNDKGIKTRNDIEVLYLDDFQ